VPALRSARAHPAPIGLRAASSDWHPLPALTPAITSAPLTATARSTSLAWIALVVAGLAFTALVAALVTAAML
jgi:hypothetical protein